MSVGFTGKRLMITEIKRRKVKAGSTVSSMTITFVLAVYVYSSDMFSGHY